jgi:hypothetical protein
MLHVLGLLYAILRHVNTRTYTGLRGDTVGCGTAPQAGRSRVPSPMLPFHNPSGRTMALESTQPLTEMSTRNISFGVKAAGA